MIFKNKKPSKKIILASIVLSLMLHLFVCKLPVDAYKASEVINPLPQNVVQVQIISVAAPNIAAVKSEQKTKKESTKTEITALTKSDAAKLYFSDKKLEDVLAHKKQVVDEKKVEAKPTTKPQQTANDNGSNISTIIPVLKNTKYTQTVAPVYPQRSIDLEQQGKVIIHALVDENGNIQDVIIKNSSGHNLLDNSAKKAVAQWRFSPSQISGKSAKAWVEVPVDFKLN